MCCLQSGSALHGTRKGAASMNNVSKSTEHFIQVCDGEVGRKRCCCHTEACYQSLSFPFQESGESSVTALEGLWWHKSKPYRLQ